MTAMDFDDIVIDLARIARLATERMMKRRAEEQKGEAFVGLPHCKRFILPTVPHRD